MSGAHDEIASLAADIRATLDWARLTGAEVLPRERLERLIPVPAAPPVVFAKELSEPAKSPPAPAPAPAPVTTRPPEAPVLEERPSRLKASSKWSALMDGPPTHTLSGPLQAKLVVLRGAGSSPGAEEMLSRMVENVLQVVRDEVAIFDLARDGREPSIIGLGVIDALSGTSPDAVIVMGTFAARAMLGEDATVSGARGRWATLKWEGGSAKARVTHHPEGILALAERGEPSAKREAFEDLKAVADLLS